MQDKTDRYPGKEVQITLQKHVSVKDECGVIAHLQELASNDHNCEHCAVAIADKTDTECRLRSYCMIQDVGGKTNTRFSVIPRKISYTLLNLCNKNKAVPAILHTHIKGYEYSDPLGFSPQDMEFINKFMIVAKRRENIPGCVFIVMNGEDILVSFHPLGTELYHKEEKQENEHAKTGTVYGYL